MNRLPNSHGCFVCGDGNPAGLGVRFRVEDDRVRTTFTPGATHMGYNGIVHGGILAALLDETMGWAPALAHRRFCVTIEMSVQYLKPVPLGQELTVSGWSVGEGRRIWEAEGEITGADGTVYAKGRGRYLPMRGDRTREVLRYLQFDEGCVPPERIADVVRPASE